MNLLRASKTGFGLRALRIVGVLTLFPLAVSSSRSVDAEVIADFAVGRIIEQVVTLDQAEQQYALYLPESSSGDGDGTFPVLFVLDPRGRAIPGIERFLPAAERHGFIVVSSYQSRSDTWASVTSEALEALLRDTERRIRIDKRRIYLAGMSGTSHAAWRLAQQLGDHVAGVIGCVGGVQVETQGPPGDAGFAYYGISAPADFNYQETVRLEQHMLKSGMAHRIDFFDGTHGWSPPEHTNRALDWMQLQAIKQGLAPLDEELVEAEYSKALATLAAAADPLEEARRRRDLLRDFDEFRDLSAQGRALAALEASAGYKSRLTQERKLARREETYYRSRMASWLADIQNLDARPPTLAASRVALQLDRLTKVAGDRAKAPEANSARRILESLFTTVAFSLPQSFQRIEQPERAALSLEVAAAIYPGRPRLYWSLAAIYARTGQVDRAFEALRTATAFGSVDLERLESDPTWAPLRSSPKWTELVAAAKRPKPPLAPPVLSPDRGANGT